MRQKPNPKIRLFTNSPLQKGGIVELSKEQSHYLVNVMRRKEGDGVLVFNGIEGEWRSNIISCGKKHCQLALEEQIRKQVASPDIWLCFAPVKNAPINYIIQKATELGVSCLQPVITKHTIVPKINIERLHSIAVEAAEQCERITIPQINEAVTLEKLIANWQNDAGENGARKLILCDESGSGKPMVAALSELEKGQKYAALIGPEGGFATMEFAMLKDQPYIVPVSMGPRIFRADTAAIVALAGIFSILGDWDEKPAFRQ